MRDLSVDVRQRVEILQTLYRDARILILDEPTAALTSPERDAVFGVLRSLAAEGRSVVLVTHKLHEVLRDNLDSRNWGSLKIPNLLRGRPQGHRAAAFLSGGNILRLAGARVLTSVSTPLFSLRPAPLPGLLVGFGHRPKAEGDPTLAPSGLRRYDMRRSEGEPRQPL